VQLGSFVFTVEADGKNYTTVNGVLSFNPLTDTTEIKVYYEHIKIYQEVINSLLPS